jgi:hypothetical protein
MSSPQKHPNVNKKKSNNKKKQSYYSEGAKWEEKVNIQPHIFLVPLVSLLPCISPLLSLSSHHFAVKPKPVPLHPEGFRSAASGTDRSPQNHPLRRRPCDKFFGGGMMTSWERARRALATRLCMRFAARHVAVEDVPRELEDVIESFPTAAEAQEEQHQDEREKSIGAASPATASARRASRSGSRSSAVRSLSPLVCLSFL